MHEVTLTLANGKHATYRVKDNGFARNVPTRPARLDWIAPDGEAESQQFSRAPTFRAEDFYPALNRAPTPQDALDGLPGARLPHGATRVTVDGRPRTGDAFLLTDGAPHTLR